MRSSWRRILDWCLSRKAVGRDKQGNVYFEETRQTGSVRKRFVKYTDESSPDVHSVPVEWWSWLHYMREEAPSDEEISRHEAHRAKVAEKVAKIEAEDHKQRLKQFVSGASSGKLFHVATLLFLTYVLGESQGGDVQQALRYLAKQHGLKETVDDDLLKRSSSSSVENSSIQNSRYGEEVQKDTSSSPQEDPKVKNL
jgi:NADH:ubiquinone oxidoreductase subunit